MFKKFYISSILLIILVTFLSSFSSSNKENYIYPVKNISNISSHYGMRELFGKVHFHNGIDIPAAFGTPICSIYNGIIKYIGFDSNGYGNYIIILHDNSYISLYGHLSENIIVNIGDRIYKGQVFAYVGPKILSNGQNNGSTTGPHLHFTLFSDNGKVIDPLSLNYEK